MTKGDDIGMRNLYSVYEKINFAQKRIISSTRNITGISRRDTPPRNIEVNDITPPIKQKNLVLLKFKICKFIKSINKVEGVWIHLQNKYVSRISPFILL